VLKENSFGFAKEIKSFSKRRTFLPSFERNNEQIWIQGRAGQLHSICFQ